MSHQDPGETGSQNDALVSSPLGGLDASWPLIVRVEDRLIVFRETDDLGTGGPRCVASVAKRQRCSNSVQHGLSLGGSEWAVADTGGEVDVIEPGGEAGPACFVQQRCNKHVNKKGPDVIPPTWEGFDPLLHADLIEYPARPTWTPDGLKHLRQGESFTAGLIDDEIEAEVSTFDRLLEQAYALRAPVKRSTVLYRYYDADDQLLYVGITDHLASRHMDHVRESSWMEFAVRSTFDRKVTREEAAAAEVRAIKVEAPLFNGTHNNTPDARLSLVRYLIEHGRTDLLAPAVSRG